MHDITPILETLFKKMYEIKKQGPKLYDLLHVMMKNQYIYYDRTKPIYVVGEEVNKAMFISEGFITRSALNKKRDPKILSILKAGEIKAGPDFIDQTPSEFLIEAIAGTFVVYITHDQLQEVYQKFPDTQGLATLIISGHHRKELRIKKKLAVKGIDKVEAFYELYPEMIVAGSVLTHEKIAGFLGMGVSSFIDHRNTLIETKRLILPDDGKKAS